MRPDDELNVAAPESLLRRAQWTIAILAICAGCSNDVMNAAVWTDERRMEKFREYHDREIGEPYYGLEEEVCRQRECIPHEDGRLEVVWEDTFEEGCSIAWKVEPSVTGSYHHPNGIVFDIIGFKKSWRYVSEPEACLFGLDWEGPW